MPDNQTLPELTLTRVFDAPRELVFQAWTDPNLLAQWWGPYGVTNPICEIDVKPGGQINITMLAGPELGELAGQRWPMTGQIKEIIAPERLVFASSPLINDQPIMDTLTTATFEDQNGQTKLTLHIQVTRVTPQAEGPLSGMEMGWTQSLDRLGQWLARQ